jgi:glycosyltransferase involved in cell wall biosynthesis
LNNYKNKSIVICSNYAWTIYNFRMSLIKSLNRSGYRVIVITQFDGYEKKIAKEVDQIMSLYISPKGINPLKDIYTFYDLFKKLSLIKPYSLLLFTIKPVIYGSIAARVMNIPCIPMITGLGTVFISRNLLTKIVKFFFRLALKKSAVVLFQNTDDKELFIHEKLVNPKVCKLTPGSGIELDRFKFQSLPNETNLTFILIARMLKDKGVAEYVEAAKQLKISFPKTRFTLLGPLDVENRTSISKNEMNMWTKEGVVEYLGVTDDVRAFIKKSSCVVLPSYREGISRVLLEASAIGRPIITSDVTGCREVVEDGINGFLCKPRNAHDLRDKMQKMIELSYANKVKMGLLGRKKIEKEYDQKIVSNIYNEELANLKN